MQTALECEQQSPDTATPRWWAPQPSPGAAAGCCATAALESAGHTPEDVTFRGRQVLKGISSCPTPCLRGRGAQKAVLANYPVPVSFRELQTLNRVHPAQEHYQVPCHPAKAPRARQNRTQHLPSGPELAALAFHPPVTPKLDTPSHRSSQQQPCWEHRSPGCQGTVWGCLWLVGTARNTI